ncbi:ATP-binding protein [Antrihabitans sp. NCIMB 15449]|uniref:histidine kinase n=1 Tax=Antrihabitans spumae TaxID=3373370 RepID=A0ABW7JJQ9_9NOCA
MSTADKAQRRTLGLRPRVILFFAVGAGLVSLALAVSVFAISRGYMVEQRERSAERQASSHVDLVRNSLAIPGTAPQAVLDSLDPPVDTVLLLRWDGEWYSSTPDLGPQSLPDGLLEKVRETTHAVETSFRDGPVLAVGIELNDSGDALFEFAPLTELRSTLTVLRTVLTACAICATIAGAMVGWWASRRVLTPLHQVAAAAAQISGGEIDTRLPDTRDHDLATIVTSFNTMVDSLQKRIERERQFFGDVSHELRTPLTTLVTSVGVLVRHQAELPPRSRLALDLISAELDHLRRLLDDLLALARTEAGLHQDALEPMLLSDLLSHTLADSKRPRELLDVAEDSTICGRKPALERALLNLMDNADSHGGGLTGITLRRDDSGAVIVIDDAGPGVAPADRSRIFDRFVTTHAGRKSPTGSGTGLGLALVAETVGAHHGSVRCDENPSGGARFVVRIPLA